MEIGGLQILREDGELAFCRGWRDSADGGRNRVLVLLPASEQTTPTILDRLAHEYSFKDELDSTWAARPLEFSRDRDQVILALEDPGGELLSGMLGTPMELGRFLGLAIAVAAAVGKVHERRLIHKDIKPDNILVNAASGEVRLTGFGIASRLTRERQSIEPPEFIGGTLAYMAPEQTGRMNRSVDSRSDLYGLGVTLYQALTGSLPFTAADPMDWVHCHIARNPAAAQRARERCPGRCLRHHHEAARQAGRGTLPDGGGPRARPAALPGRMARRSRRRYVSARPTGHARPAADSREALRQGA